MENDISLVVCRNQVACLGVWNDFATTVLLIKPLNLQVVEIIRRRRFEITTKVRAKVKCEWQLVKPYFYHSAVAVVL